MKNSTKQGGSVKKKYQAGGMIANARKKNLINRYNKVSDRAKNAQARTLSADNYFQNKYTNYDDDYKIQGANPVAFTAGRKRQNAKINKAQARVGENAKRETQLYKNVYTAEQAYKNNKSDENSAKLDAALDARNMDDSTYDTARTLSKIRGIENRVERKVNNKWDKNEKRVEKIGKKLDKMGPKKTTAKIKAGGSVKKKMASGGAVIASPIQTRLGNKPVAGSNMAKGGQKFPDLTGDGKVTKADVLKGRGVFKKGGQKHPGFKAVQSKIAAKQGVSKKAAGAILASATRKASAKAKASNPRLKRVK